MEDYDFNDIQYMILSLPSKEQGKLLKSILENENIDPKHKLFYAKLAQEQAAKGLKQQSKDAGKIPVKRIDPIMSTEGFIYMLENKSTPEDSLAYLNKKFNQPEGWDKKVKNRVLPDYERKANITHLKLKHSEDNITLLQRLLENQYTSFKEIQEPTTYNKQLKHLESVIKISDRVDNLEKEVSELREFKQQQMLFNSVLVNEISTQREIVDSMVEHINPKYKGTQEERMLLDAQLSLIPEVKDKITYLLNLNITKKDISIILGIPRRSLYRMLPKS